MAAKGGNGVALSTLQVAREIGVHRSSLLRWLQSGELPEPRHVRAAGQDVRVWSREDVERARALKEAGRNGWAARREKSRRVRKLDEHRRARRLKGEIA